MGAKLDDTEQNLNLLTEAAYVKGFMDCIVRVGKEALERPGQSPVRLIERLNAEACAMAGRLALKESSRHSLQRPDQRGDG